MASLLTTASRNWWNAPKGKVNTVVLPYVRTVENYQAQLFDKFVKLEAIYDTNPRTNRSTGAIGAMRGQGTSRAIITENLIASNVDTVAANVADTDIKVRIQTDRADWSHQRRAKALEYYADGLSKMYEVGAKCRTGFKAGAAIKGTGLNKVWVDQFDQIRVTTVPIDNIVVDEIECRDGKPRQLHYRDFFDKDDLAAQFPEYADEIMRAQSFGNWRLWAGYRPLQSNECVVIESWRLPIGPVDHPRHIPGRHTLTIDGCDLLDEEYEKTHFPFAKMVWNAPVWGFYGISLAERILPHQNLLNRRNYQINRSLDLKADPVTYVHQADQNLAVKTVNQIGSIAVYKTEIPKTVDHQAVGPETYQSRMDIKASAAEETGTNSSMQSGGVPAGIESGVGVREVRTTRTQRFSIQEKAFEAFWLDTVWLILDCCKDLGDKAPDILKVSKYGARKIKWSQVDMGDLRIEMAAASTLGDTPAGRQQRVVELAQAGVITLDESRQLMDHPDIEGVMSMYNAMLESAEYTIERILDGDIVAPSPFQNLDATIKLMQKEYLRISVDPKDGGAPEEILEALADFMSQAAAILNPPAPAMAAQPGMPVPPPGAQPPGPPGAGPAMPPGIGPAAQQSAGAGAFNPAAFNPMTA